jgi:hypothetical protein
MFGSNIQVRYPNPNDVVYPNCIPYRGTIPGGLHEGKLIEVKGHIPYGSDVFQINLLTGLDPNSDRALHISVRFHGRTVVRNALQQSIWGPEERQGLFPFVAGQDFTLLILVDPGAYRIAVNNQHCWEFAHRVPFIRVSSIFVDGTVKIERIEFVDKVTPGMQPSVCVPPSVGIQPGICPIPPAVVLPPPENLWPLPRDNYNSGSNLSPVYNPPIPYAYPIYGGIKPGMMIYISGRPSANPYRFTFNLQNGTAPYPPPDIAFHFDVRFYNFTVIRNSRTNNVWAKEEFQVSHFPFQPAVNFDMIIKIEGDRYMIALNGQHFMEFRHRLTPLSRFDTLYIENDIVVSSIRFA